LTGENDGYADNISFLLGLLGDLNLDGAVNVSDWILFRNGQQVNMAGLTQAQARALGDLDGDFRNDHADFVLFKATFESLNGTGSFATMLATVPEPATILLMLFGGFGIAGQAGRRRCRSVR
jgi:hypothetical protein